MFLLYHSDRCNTSETVFHWCYVNDLHTTHAVVCWVTTEHLGRREPLKNTEPASVTACLPQLLAATAGQQREKQKDHSGTRQRRQPSLPTPSPTTKVSRKRTKRLLQRPPLWIQSTNARSDRIPSNPSTTASSKKGHGIPRLGPRSGTNTTLGANIRHKTLDCVSLITYCRLARVLFGLVWTSSCNVDD
jgi:hypothetical protein